MSKNKNLYDYKLGEICSTDLCNGLMKAPNKCVAISITFQSKNGTQMQSVLKHEDFIEDKDDDDLEENDG